MKQYTFEVFAVRSGRPRLRFFGPNGGLIGTRELAEASVGEIQAVVEKNYQLVGPNLAELGQKLYRWLDGPERWLAEPLETGSGFTLRLDAEGPLRNFPWELLSLAGVYLCADPLRPLTPMRRVSHQRAESMSRNRPLRILFMACSPEDVLPVLDFEKEESLVLEATRRQPIELVVEESGSLAGLQEQVASVEAGHFDVLHLTGHAGLTAGRPHFLMEDELGRARAVTASEFARTFMGRWPRLTFLSGCRTGQAVEQGTLPSLCEALVAAGAPAVLGWALPVGDEAASVAAAALYRHLAIGGRLDEAVASARQVLFEQPSPFWHLLRLYTDDTPASELVTPLKTPGREPFRFIEAQKVFLDPGSRREVCPRGRFVGRRRVLQRCLRALQTSYNDTDYVEGVLIYGLGGMGKSSLAARICDRIPNFRRIVWLGKIDEVSFQEEISPRLDHIEEIHRWEEQRLPLQTRLRQLLEGTLDSPPTLFVFDGFEKNLEAQSDGSFLAMPEALNILKALQNSIRLTAARSRVIITSRYLFPFAGSMNLLTQPLQSMSGAELAKKLAQLPSFSGRSGRNNNLAAHATSLAGGNPALLEILDGVLSQEDTDDHEMMMALTEATNSFRGYLCLQEVLKAQPDETRLQLALASIFEWPVTSSDLAMVAGQNGFARRLKQAETVGLIEVSALPMSPVKERASFQQHDSEPLLAEREVFAGTVSQASKDLKPMSELDRLESLPEGAAEAPNQSYFVSPLIRPLLAPELRSLKQLEEWISKAKAIVDQFLIMGPDEISDSCDLNLLVAAHKLLILGGNVDLATGLLLEEIDPCLLGLGSYGKLLELHGQLRAYLKSARHLCMCWLDVGYAHLGMGDLHAAKADFEHSLKLSREKKEKICEASALMCLGTCYNELGEIDQAIRCLSDSVRISGTEKASEIKLAGTLSLGLCYEKAGSYPNALAHFNAVLRLARDIGNTTVETSCLISIANCQAALGATDDAILHFQEALERTRGTDPLTYGTGLQSLAEALLDKHCFSEAAARAEEGIQLGREIRSIKLLSENESSLARAYLMTGQVELAKAAAERASQLDVPDNRHHAFLLLGISALLRSRPDDAWRAFTAALQNANGLAKGQVRSAEALETHALALCGLVISGSPARSDEARHAIQDLGGLSQAVGRRRRFVDLLTLIQRCDSTGVLSDLRL
jgi:tetratricopeptide (TPR) repeat protein